MHREDSFVWPLILVEMTPAMTGSAKGRPLAKTAAPLRIGIHGTKRATGTGRSWPDWKSIAVKAGEPNTTTPSARHFWWSRNSRQVFGAIGRSPSLDQTRTNKADWRISRPVQDTYSAQYVVIRRYWLTELL
jgi:hypothetical protein